MIKKIQTLGLYALAIGTCVYLAVSLTRIITTTAPDFPSFYYATQDFLQHKNAYTDKTIPNIFIYPAATSLLYLPFIIFPYNLSQAIFVILSALAVPVIVWISLKIILKTFSCRYFVIGTSLAFLSFPTKFTLGMGQVNVLALLLLMLGFYVYLKKKIVLCGMLVGIAMLWKPILSFMLLFFIMQKAWKTLFTIAATMAGLFLLSFLVYGYEMEIYYFTHILPGLISGTDGREVYYNQGLMGFVSRLTTEPLFRKVISMLLSLVVIAFTVYIIKKQKVTTPMQFALVLTLLPIVHTLSWQHYFVVLIFPFILAIFIILKIKRYAYLWLLGLSYVLISWNIKDPSQLLYFPSNLLLSHTLYGAIILYIVLISLNRSSTHASMK